MHINILKCILMLQNINIILIFLIFFSATKSQDYSNQIKRLVKNGTGHCKRMCILRESSFYSQGYCCQKLFIIHDGTW